MFLFEERTPAQYWLEFHPPFTADDEEAYLASLHALAAIENPFAVIAVFGGDTPLSPDNRKRQNLWFKQHKATLGTWCRGLVRVSPHYAQEGMEDGNYGKAMPFPVWNMHSPETAIPVAASFLGGGTET